MRTGLSSYVVHTEVAKTFFGHVPTERLSQTVRSVGGNRLLNGSEVFAVSDEYIFKTKTEFVAQKVAALWKIVGDPEACQVEAAAQLKIENDMIDASLAFGQDMLLVNRAIKIFRDTLQKAVVTST